jgi:hypothetical protein
MPDAANVRGMHGKLSSPHLAVHAQIRHVRGLVLIRSLLAGRSATPAELAVCDAVIAAGRRELADLVARADAYVSAA